MKFLIDTTRSDPGHLPELAVPKAQKVMFKESAWHVPIKKKKKWP